MHFWIVSFVEMKQMYNFCLYFFFSIIVYYKVLNVVPCAIQYNLVVYLFYNSSLYLLIPNSEFIPFPPPFPLW